MPLSKASDEPRKINFLLCYIAKERLKQNVNYKFEVRLVDITCRETSPPVDNKQVTHESMKSEPVVVTRSTRIWTYLALAMVWKREGYESACVADCAFRPLHYGREWENYDPARLLVPTVCEADHRLSFGRPALL